MYIGKPLLRGEDPRLLRGQGRFTDDIDIPDMAYAAFVRSPHAHANIINIDCQTVAAQAGVLKVLTAQDWRNAKLGPLPCISDISSSDNTPMRGVERPVFAAGRVCHVGDCVAAVIADSREIALAAAESLEVDYAPLASVVEPTAAITDDAPLVHAAFETNLAHFVEYGDREATAQAFARAAHVTEVSFRHQRVTASPIEPRAYIASHASDNDHYTLWAAGQNPHFLQRLLATYVLHIPLPRLRVICPDVGGGFGSKFYGYPEQAALLHAAKLVGRPVRWTATRSEAMMTDTHARHHDCHAALALDNNGRILAIRCESTNTYGAYQSTFSPVILMHTMSETLSGMYQIPVGYLRINGVYTHTTPVDAYRGVKQASTYICEQLIDTAARELGVDPMDIRLRNYLKPTDYPHTHMFNLTYDSGNPPLQHETLTGLVDYRCLRAEQAKPRKDGRRLGIGVAAVQESTGLGPSKQLRGDGLPIGAWEAARVRVHPDGKVTVYTGTHSHGQGHEITFRQVVADGLGVDIDDIEFTQGDSELGPGNLGTAAARSLSTAGIALAEGALRVINKGKQLAAHLLECAETDINYAAGQFFIPGTDRQISFVDIAEMAYAGFSYPAEGFELGLEETVFYDPIATGFPTALHLAVVLVDEETGAVEIRDYFTVDDCGRVINPMVVEGQVHGGLAQGIGQALLEHMAYDPENGQLLTGSFMDYGLPRADMLPMFQLAFQETLNPNNALGVKGGSETGITGAPAALHNALLDALWPIGVRSLQMPFTSWRIWAAIQAAR